MQVPAPREAVQRHDGIPDQLARTVIGHVAPALHLDHLDAPATQLGFACDQIRRAAAASQRQDRRMLDQQ